MRHGSRESEIRSISDEVFAILGMTKFDHKRNEDILAQTKQCLVGELVTRARLRWPGSCSEDG